MRSLIVRHGPPRPHKAELDKVGHDKLETRGVYGMCIYLCIYAYVYRVYGLGFACRLLVGMIPTVPRIESLIILQFPFVFAVSFVLEPIDVVVCKCATV